MKRNTLGLTILISAVTSTATFSQLNNDEMKNKTPPKPDIMILPESKNTDAYWTEDRMRAAKPMPEPEISADELEHLKSEAYKKDSHLSNKNEKTLIIEPSGVDAQEISEHTEGQPEEADVNQRPFWNAGKLYFSAPDGDYTCSAQFVGHKRVLMTAAHCIRDRKTGEWYKNFIFYQGFRDGSWDRSFGIYCQAVWNNWITGNETWNWSKDYGFLTTYLDSGAGWLGMKSGIPYFQFTALGYPVNYMGANYLQKVNGHFGEKSYNSVVRMDGNPMGSGASGGAWIAELTTSTASGNYAVGLNSYHNYYYPGSEFGPYFDRQVFELHKLARDNCHL